jgi:hypothetical protein
MENGTEEKSEKSAVEEAVAQTEPKNGEAGEKKSHRTHGRSFIYINLKDADDALRKIDHLAKKMSQESFARALGHEPKSSRFKQKLNALQDYKLVEADDEDVTLTQLAVDMLYGASAQAQARARAQAFLSYDLFSKTFSECPKNQDYELSYLIGYVKAKLSIANEVETYIRRFLESAHFAGLLEGEPNPGAATIRLRPALVASSNGEGPSQGQAKSADDQWVLASASDEAALLEGLGLTQYEGRCVITQKSSGDVAINMADGKIAVEVRRPIRVVITPGNMLEEVTGIIKALQSKGFKA